MDQLRIRFWYEGLWQRIRPYSRSDLIRIVGRRKTGLDAPRQVDPSQLKKWKAFASGQRAPRQSLIYAADSAVGPRGSGQGSAAEYNLLLWDVLSQPAPGPRQWQTWMERLSPSVREIANSAPRAADARQRRVRIPSLRSLELGKLRNRPSFDSLALLCMVLSQAHQVADEALAHAVGQQLVNSSWQMALVLEQRRLAEPFFSFLERWVLPYSRSGSLRVSFGPSTSTRIALLDYTARVRRSRIRRESLELAAAKIVRSAARKHPFSALAFQYCGMHCLYADGAKPTAKEFRTLWFEQAVSELLSHDTSPWGPVATRLWDLCFKLETMLSTGSATPHEPEDDDTPYVSLRLLHALCPSAMDVFARLAVRAHG